MKELNIVKQWLERESKQPNFAKEALEKAEKEAEKTMKILKQGETVVYTVPYQINK